MVRYIHGSADSTDLDTVYVFDALPDFEECARFCRSRKDENANIIVIRDGVVSECFKGIRDEVNNALLFTCALHEQESPLLIERALSRDVFLKDIVITRKVISQWSRSSRRREVKAALRGGWKERLCALRDLNMVSLDAQLEDEAYQAELRKRIAFQLGQGIGLHNGIELYTKSDICAYRPALMPYLYRKAGDAEALSSELHEYLDILEKTAYEEIGAGCVKLLSSGEIYDIHNERLVSLR